MKEIIKKWWFWIIILIIITSVSVLIFSLNKDVSKNYKNQTISILSKYKSGDLTRKEASEKIKNISKKIDDEPKIKDEYDSARILLLQTKLSKLSLELFDNELSDTVISNYIKEIKEI